MKKIDDLMNKIESTNYWDAQILDIKSLFLGHEVHLYIENDEETCWSIQFLLCYKVDYETDAGWLNWRDVAVKDLRGGQLLGYSGQNIELERELLHGTMEFVKCSITLSNIQLTIICRDITVEKVKLADQHFFWRENKD